MVWRLNDPQGNEAAKVKYDIVPYTRGVVLDMGCGPSKAYRHFLGVDSCKDTELFGIAMRPEIRCDVGDPQAVADTFQSLSVDAIFSSHCLEHIEDYRAALAAWWDIIKPGGHLVLYLPHRELYPNIGTYGANPDHKHDFVAEDIIRALEGFTPCLDVLVNETRAQDCEYSFLLVVRKLAAPHEGFYTYTQPKPAKTVCIVRYGGFGDMVQAANVFPAFKRAGFHVTVMTTPSGRQVVEHDPHIDAFIVQDTDQVPNEELSEYWEAQAKRFDAFVNLSESVEGTLLAYVGRANHMWPDSVRRKYLGRNYLEWMSELAEVPYACEARFYPTPEETGVVDRFIGTIRRRAAGVEGIAGPTHAPPTFNIMWTLSGSSVHKMYPHQDEVIQHLLATIPECTVTLVGDELSQLLEAGWENHPRVHCMAGRMTIRDTLALAQRMDAVVGPETGVLNAVAFEPNGKVCMLSHSSRENLTRDWVNTESIVPPTACHPCHRLHHDRRFCPEHKPSGASMCAWETDPQQVFNAIVRIYTDWKQLREMRAAA